MNSQPIIARELTRAARYRRLWATRVLVPGLMLASFRFAFTASVAATPGPIGRKVFATMVAVAVLAFIVAGMVQIAGCIARERREGTLGLLLLTRVTVFDVVVGKVLGRTLVLWQGLLAAAPILCLPILLGGVSVTDWWNAVIHLASVLFVSVFISVLASACSRDEGQAVVVTVVALVSYALLPLLMDFLFFGNIPRSKSGTFGQLSLIHPVLMLFQENFPISIRFSPPNRWLASGAHFGIGIACLFLASWRIRAHSEPVRTVRLKTRPAPMSIKLIADKLFGLLDGTRPGNAENPVQFLALACWRQARSMRNLSVGGGFAILIGLWAFNLKTADVVELDLNPLGLERIALQLVMMLFIWRLLAQARHERLFELIVCTPFGTEQFLRGYWDVLRKLFLWPLGLLVIAQLFYHSGGTGFFGFILLALYLLLDCTVEFLYLGWIGLCVAFGPGRGVSRTVFPLWLTATGLLELFAPWALVIEGIATLIAVQAMPETLVRCMRRVDCGLERKA